MLSHSSSNPPLPSFSLFSASLRPFLPLSSPFSPFLSPPSPRSPPFLPLTLFRFCKIRQAGSGKEMKSSVLQDPAGGQWKEMKSSSARSGRAGSGKEMKAKGPKEKKLVLTTEDLAAALKEVSSYLMATYSFIARLE
ncbi:unnamed protein product [Closterium sp. NIES-65]|nr:unnamed protein product [Closterium sp. NIES-65]